MHIALIKKNIVILGAGITGLSTAHYLSLKNKDFLVLEKSNRIGGNIFSEKKEDYIIENGPNTVLLSNDSIIKLIKESKNSYPIFIHCEASIERSPIIALAWLMHSKKISLQESKFCNFR